MPALFETRQLIFEQMIHYPDLEFAAGKVNFLVGESGTGKSTLFKLINRTLSPSAGEIFYRGNPLGEWDVITLRREVTLVSQESFLFDDTIEGNFRAFYSYREQIPPDRERISSWLALCGLNFSPDQSCQVLSGGERQRVFLAVNLSFSPGVLLLDEPTSALDDRTSRLVVGQIIEHCRQRGTELILISHNPALVEEFSEHTVVIQRGDFNGRG